MNFITSFLDNPGFALAVAFVITLIAQVAA